MSIPPSVEIYSVDNRHSIDGSENSSMPKSIDIFPESENSDELHDTKSHDPISYESDPRDN